MTSITICRSLLSGKTPREIIDQLVQLFDAERLIAERDVIDFTEALLEKVFFMSEIEIYGKKQYVQALAEKASKKGKILSAMIELLDQCNFHCRYCYVRGSTNSTLSLESVKKVLDQLREVGCIWLTLTGGEPLLHPHFLEIYNYAYDLGFAVTILTNGYLLTSEHIALFQKKSLG